MAEIEPNVIKELEIAQGAAQGAAPEEELGGIEASVMGELREADAAVGGIGASGAGTAKYVLIDYYTTSALRRIWAYIPNTGWKYRNISEGQVATIGKVAMEAKVIQVWWTDSQITLMRCWKYL